MTRARMLGWIRYSREAGPRPGQILEIREFNNLLGGDGDLREGSTRLGGS